MENSGVFHFIATVCLFIFLLPDSCLASIQSKGTISPPFKAAQMDFIDNNGLFLLSNNSNFGFGIQPTQNATLYQLVIVHLSSSTVVWSANRNSPIQNSDPLMFDEDGNLQLQSGQMVVWTTNSAGKGVSLMELQNSGNLVLLGNDNSVIWQSFSHPTDTLISSQDFIEGMKLVSNPNERNLTYFLEIKSRDMILYAGFQTPQPYWSLNKDSSTIVNKDGGEIAIATLDDNSWKFYDRNKDLLSQLLFPEATSPNSTWIAVLGNNGIVSFVNLPNSGSSIISQTKIPKDPCGTPEPCEPYSVCSGENNCQCAAGLFSFGGNCSTGIISPCEIPKDSDELVEAGDGLTYFALGFVPPSLNTDLEGCKSSCRSNCSCMVLFYENASRNCYLFDHVGSFQSAENGNNIVSFIKVSNNGRNGESPGGGKGSSNSHLPIIVIIVISTVIVIMGLLYAGYRFYRKRNQIPESPKENSDEDNFLESLSGMPIRFTYKDLQTATNNFEVKLGQGGFGSVYQGALPDGTRLAVKKLEGIGQGKKEFRAEVSIIGSIHHHHLVRLKGFCAEGTHRLLAYEYMANGSLDRWIFRKNKEEVMLDWDTRFNIAVGTAKGLAYLHEDCDVKIVHCDIKPENVLLDDKFFAKVSDFGLAKLMTREQSHVFTTLRGTRGYLAPEWITNYAISEKSDVYSYGMVLLEIIGGRKNFDAHESSEKSHFPSYAFKMMEEGRLREILDSQMLIDEEDERVSSAIKVALWCIQDDIYLRPSMAKVVQMLEGLCSVPPPPTASQMGSRLYSNFFKSMSEGGTSSGPSDCNSDAYLSAVRLSGPR